MDCCINDLGRFSHNLKIETGLIATQAGEHYLFMNAATGGTFTLTKSLGVGEEITIEIGQLNESMVYNFKINYNQMEQTLKKRLRKFQITNNYKFSNRWMR